MAPLRLSRLGRIPAEVKRRAATMTPQSFTVTEEDVAELRETYGDTGYGDRLACHLRERGGEGLQHRPAQRPIGTTLVCARSGYSPYLCKERAGGPIPDP